MPEELVTAALAAAPSRCTVAARNPDYDLDIGGRAVTFVPVGGPPYMSDLVNGRRPGTLAGFEDFVRLTQSFDVLHSLAPCTEPQDVAVELRHLVTTRAMAVLSVKPIYVFARGDQIINDTFELIRIASGVSDDEFRGRPHCWTNINVNSPRQLDVPMSMGIIAFARAGQVCIMTPFTLAGAMAPVSLAGALLLQHVEVLSAVTLAQTVRPGAPWSTAHSHPTSTCGRGRPRSARPRRSRALLPVVSWPATSACPGDRQGRIRQMSKMPRPVTRR